MHEKLIIFGCGSDRGDVSGVVKELVKIGKTGDFFFGQLDTPFIVKSKPRWSNFYFGGMTFSKFCEPCIRRGSQSVLLTNIISNIENSFSVLL